MTLAQAVREALQAHSGKVICRDPDHALTGGELLAACRTAAAKLAAAPGQRVGLLLPGGAAYPAALLGAVWCGKVAVPLNPMLKPNELAFILQDAGIRTVVVTAATHGVLAGLDVNAIPLADLLQPGAGPTAPAEANPDDVAVLLYTSGTSGRPKGVPLTHANLLGNARALIARTGASDRDAVLGVLPLFHAFGLTLTMMVPFLVGAEVTYLRFTPERAVAVMAERKVTLFVAVPGMFGLLARCKGAEEGMQNLTHAVCGGEALPATLREAFGRRFGRPLLEGYGLTETSPVLAVNLPSAHKPGTVGRPLPGVQVRITSDEAEIQVRGPNVMTGYYNRPEETAAAFTADGWFRTGDQGRLDADGYLSISGRIKELIIRGGEKIMPREVEDVLGQFPGVREAAVVGEPDGDRGEAVVAYVVAADPEPTPEALRAFCRERLAEFKVPRRFRVATDLPRGPTGKVLKRVLKDGGPA